MEKGRLILGSRVGLANFLLGGLMIGTDGKLVWQDEHGNRSKPVTGKAVKIPASGANTAGLSFFECRADPPHTRLQMIFRV